MKEQIGTFVAALIQGTVVFIALVLIAHAPMWAASCSGLVVVHIWSTKARTNNIALLEVARAYERLAAAVFVGFAALDEIDQIPMYDAVMPVLEADRTVFDRLPDDIKEVLKR